MAQITISLQHWAEGKANGWGRKCLINITCGISLRPQIPKHILGRTTLKASVLRNAFTALWSWESLSYLQNSQLLYKPDKESWPTKKKKNLFKELHRDMLFPRKVLIKQDNVVKRKHYFFMHISLIICFDPSHTWKIIDSLFKHNIHQHKAENFTIWVLKEILEIIY